MDVDVVVVETKEESIENEHYKNIIIENEQEIPTELLEQTNPPPEEDEVYEDISLYDIINSRRSPKQDRSSKRILRKSSVRLAGINKDGFVEEEKSEEVEISLKSSKKKKSLKNLYGLLSFSGKSKSDASPTKASMGGGTLERSDTNSTDGTTNTASFSTENGSVNTTAIEHTTNPIKRESIGSPNGQLPLEVLSTNGGEDTVVSSATNSPVINKRSSALKIRSKSIHRVVSLRSYEQEKQSHSPLVVNTEQNYEEQSTTISSPTSPFTAAGQLFPLVADSEYSEENMVEPQFLQSIQKEQSGSFDEPRARVNSYDIIDQKGRKRSITAVTDGAPIPPPPPELPIVQAKEEIDLLVPPLSIDEPQPRSSFYDIIDQNGRKRSITAVTEGAPIPPPPPELPIVQTKEGIDLVVIPPVTVQTPDGRRVSIKPITAGAPIVPPPPPVLQTNPIDSGISTTDESPEEETTTGVIPDSLENREEDYVGVPPLSQEEVELPVAVLQTPDGRRISITALTPGAPIVPPPPPLRNQVIVESNSTIETEEDKAEVEEGENELLNQDLNVEEDIFEQGNVEAFDEAEQYLLEEAQEEEQGEEFLILPENEESEKEVKEEQIEAVYLQEEDEPDELTVVPQIEVVQTTDGRRLSIRSFTPGAPAPPPPPPARA